MSDRRPRMRVHHAPRRSRPTPTLLLVFTLTMMTACRGSGDTPVAHTARETSHSDHENGFAVRLTDDPETRRYVIEIGPVDLPQSPPEHAHRHHEYGALPPVQSVTFPRRVYLTGWDYEVFDAEGNRLPTSVLHHLNLINLDRRELFLPIAQRMLAVGAETGSKSIPGFLLGYPVAAGTEAAVKVMLHNPTERDISGARLRLHLSYVESGRPWPLVEVHPFHMDVAFPNTDNTAFDLPPGRSSFSWTGSPAIDGRVLVLGSHLHEFAERIVLEDETDGKVIWQGYPIEDEEGALLGTTTDNLYWRLGARITADRSYRATVYYHNPTPDTLYDGGMGVVAGLIRPDSRADWPEAAKSDPLYMRDRRAVMREAQEGDHHVGHVH